MSTPQPPTQYPNLSKRQLSGTPPYPPLRALADTPGRRARDAAPPTDLLPESFAALLYSMLQPLAQLDPDAGWSLLILCNAIGVMFQEVDGWVRDTPDGPGWSQIMDLNRCPSDSLAWLAQFAGVRIPDGLDDADARAWVASTDGFRRGTPAAIVAAAQATLTGTKTVLLGEREGGGTSSPDYAYYLSVFTYASETPNPAATQAALIAQKPAGIVLVYATVSGQTYGTLHANYATYAAVKAAYTDYNALKAG